MKYKYLNYQKGSDFFDSWLGKNTHSNLKLIGYNCKNWKNVLWNSDTYTYLKKMKKNMTLIICL